VSHRCETCDRGDCERFQIEQRGRGSAFWDVEAYIRSCEECRDRCVDWRKTAQRLEIALRYAYENERTGAFDFDEWRATCEALLGPPRTPGNLTIKDLETARNE
jgi:hypothetical protein